MFGASSGAEIAYLTFTFKWHYFLFSSAPCPPLNIQSIMNCGSNTASVSWSGGNGALSFTMTMECSNGQTYICSTNEKGCDITNMACGQTCTVTVVAEGRSCNSSAGTGSPVITGKRNDFPSFWTLSFKNLGSEKFIFLSSKDALN